MKFADHILYYFGSSYDHAAAQRRINGFCAVLIQCMTGAAMLAAATALRHEVRRAVTDALQAHRYAVKLNMLRSPSWLLRVVKDLGGIEALLAWSHKASPSQNQALRKRTPLSPQEIARRAHARLCAKACAHPNIRRDPFRVDLSGEFRLAPRGRAFNPHATPRDYEYKYDARPLNDFKGMNQPIMIWPDEVFVFMSWHHDKDTAAEVACKTVAKTVEKAEVKRWLAHFVTDVKVLPQAVREDASFKPP